MNLCIIDNKPFYGRVGNYERTTKEVNAKAAKGAPTDITGVYMRNGPNPIVFPWNAREHFFDGDSMVHAIRIKDG